MRIRDVVGRNPGSRRVELRFAGGPHPVRVVLPADFRIAFTDAVKAELAPWLR